MRITNTSYISIYSKLYKMIGGSYHVDSTFIAERIASLIISTADCYLECLIDHSEALNWNYKQLFSFETPFCVKFPLDVILNPRLT